MNDYLYRAAELIAKAAESNERALGADPLYRRELNKHRMEHATAYAMLAAIDKGLLPEQVADQVYDQFKTQTSR